MKLRVNGQEHEVEAAADTPLLYVLRNDCELNGPKFGCGLGECGACTVLVDGVPARSCVIACGGMAGREITTLEGLVSGDKLHPVQQAFVEAQGAQCGYCLNGMVMSTKALIDRNPAPTEAEIREALRYQLCRCGTHMEILAAARRAVELCAQEREPQAAGAGA